MHLRRVIIPRWTLKCLIISIKIKTNACLLRKRDQQDRDEIIISLKHSRFSSHVDSAWYTIWSSPQSSYAIKSITLPSNHFSCSLCPLDFKFSHFHFNFVTISRLVYHLTKPEDLKSQQQQQQHTCIPVPPAATSGYMYIELTYTYINCTHDTVHLVNNKCTQCKVLS